MFLKMSDWYKTELKIKIMPTSIIILLHSLGLYGAYLFLTKAAWQTCLFAYILHVCAMIGMTAGAHRLWSHKSYKAKLPLRVILVLFQTLTLEYSVLDWARIHRVHHKHVDTDADPHNATRGFFFSHIGWIMTKEHADVKTNIVAINMTDLLEEKLLRFQHEYYFRLVTLVNIIIPVYVSTLWGESPWTALCVVMALRHIITHHSSFLINSWAHLWGTKPYDKNIKPVESWIVSFMAVGEGFHNYHHTFPWDYKTAELGSPNLNFAKLFIDFMAKIGWAYDLKTVSEEVIQNRAKRTGDGTHPVCG